MTNQELQEGLLNTMVRLKRIRTPKKLGKQLHAKVCTDCGGYGGHNGGFKGTSIGLELSKNNHNRDCQTCKGTGIVAIPGVHRYF